VPPRFPAPGPGSASGLECPIFLTVTPIPSYFALGFTLISRTHPFGFKMNREVCHAQEKKIY